MCGLRVHILYNTTLALAGNVLWLGQISHYVTDVSIRSVSCIWPSWTYLTNYNTCNHIAHFVCLYSRVHISFYITLAPIQYILWLGCMGIFRTISSSYVWWLSVVAGLHGHILHNTTFVIISLISYVWVTSAYFVLYNPDTYSTCFVTWVAWAYFTLSNRVMYGDSQL